jgi:hypothetical protein
MSCNWTQRETWRCLVIREHWKSDQSSCEYYVLYIFDGHGEYPFLRNVRNDTTFKLPDVCHEIWDGFALTDLIGENAVIDAAKSLPQQIRNLPDDGWGTIWKIQGTLKQLEYLYAKHCDVMFTGPIGSDDDTYDYWPSGMDMAFDLAIDLDDMTRSRRDTSAFMTRWKTFVKTNERSDGEPTYYDDVWTPPAIPKHAKFPTYPRMQTHNSRKAGD